MVNENGAKPIAYLYSGVQLSPLPEYDKETYPYALIVYRELVGDCLMVSTVPLVKEGYGFCIPEGVSGKAILYTHEIDGLHELAEVGPFVVSKEVEVDGTSTSVWERHVLMDMSRDYTAQWANYDVYAKNGNLVLATSEAPTPVYAMSYNGIKLPPLPENLIDPYPYITLCKNHRPEYWLIYTKEPPTFDGVNICFTDGIEQCAFTALPHAVTWYSYERYAYNDGYLGGWSFEHPADKYEYTPYIPVWSNTDIYNTDGSVYLPASDPVPVGGAEWKKQDVYKPPFKTKKYRYNGIELPTLPEYDKNAYPYVFICENDYYIEGELLLYVCSFKAEYEIVYGLTGNFLGYNLYAQSDGYKLRYRLSSDEREWVVDERYNGGEPNHEIQSIWIEGSSNDPYFLKWANYDIYYTDYKSNGELAGTLYLAASEPVPITRYLYNGVELPLLPEYDKTQYPYAVIEAANGIRGALLTVMPSDAAYFRGSSGGWYFGFKNDGSSEPNGGPSWEYDSATDTWRESVGRANILLGVDTGAWFDTHEIWSNFDILNEDGSVYLKASDPVPVTHYQKQDVYLCVGGQWVKQDKYLI